jgi:hypothetical protein
MRSTLSRSIIILATLVLLALVPHEAAAVIFTLQPGSKKCLVEDISRVSRMFIEYSMPRARAVFTSVTVTGPKGEALYEEKQRTHERKHSFTPLNLGEHAICFTSTEASKVTRAQPFDIAFTLATEAEFASQRTISKLEMEGATAKDKNSKNRALMVQAKYTLDGLTAMHQDFKSFIAREARMRITTESAFTRANVMSVITALLVVAVGGLSYYTLKRHLKSRKILD